MMNKLLILSLAAIIPLGADTLYMKDGQSIRGTFLSGDSRQIRFTPEGATRGRSYAVSNVANVVFGDSTPVASANDRPRYDRQRYGRYDSSRSRSARIVVLSGTVVTVRTIDSINSDENNVGDTFRATLEDPIVVNGQTVVPTGSDVTIKIVRVEQSGRITGHEEVALALDSVMVNGQRVAAVSNDAEVAAKSRGEQSAKVIGGTAVVGAIIGAIAGGGKGAAIGAATGAGAGAAIQAIRGQRIQIPSESRLDFALIEPMYID